MKRKMLAVCMALVMALSLAACGGASKGASMNATASVAPGYAPREEAKLEYVTMDSAAEMDYGNGMIYEEPKLESESGAVSGQKLIRTAYLTMETTEFEQAVQGLTELTESFGGYFETSTVTNRKTGSRWAEYTVRVPADKYSAFLSQAGELCHLTRQESTQDDISEVYYDTQGRLKTQQIKLERLQALLAKAEKMEDIITIESAISETEQMIDSLSGTLRRYDGKVDYATVHINMQEVYKLSNVEEVPDTFGQRLGRAFSNGISDFVDSMEDLVVSLAYSWMWWLIVVVIAVVVVKAARKRVKLRRLKKKSDKQEEN